MTKRFLTRNQEEYLRELGLSKQAVRLYATVLDKKRLSASQAAGNKFASAQYRLFYRLEEYGLVRRIKGRPIVFEAVSPDVALPVSFQIKETKLKQLLQKNLATSDDSIQMRLLVGRQAMYDEYAKQAIKAHQTIHEYTIGIAYSENFVNILRSAAKRGVRLRMVAQQLKPSNYHALHKWRKLGVDVRLSPAERGFHLMLFDGKIAIITFSNPANTEERLSIVTDNTAVIKQFESYFETIWRNAREVDV